MTFSSGERMKLDFVFVDGTFLSVVFSQLGGKFV